MDRKDYMVQTLWTIGIVTFIVLFLCLAKMAFAFCSTDYQCVSLCTSQGMGYGYCSSACKYCN